jgi:hypothetical protein
MAEAFTLAATSRTTDLRSCWLCSPVASLCVSYDRAVPLRLFIARLVGGRARSLWRCNL